MWHNICREQYLVTTHTISGLEKPSTPLYPISSTPYPLSPGDNIRPASFLASGSPQMHWSVVSLIAYPGLGELPTWDWNTLKIYTCITTQQRCLLIQSHKWQCVRHTIFHFSKRMGLKVPILVEREVELTMYICGEVYNFVYETPSSHIRGHWIIQLRRDQYVSMTFAFRATEHQSLLFDFIKSAHV